MASAHRDKKGNAYIQFAHADGRRGTFRLGKVSDRAVDDTLARVRALLDDRTLGRRHDADLQTWLDKLPDSVHDRLAKLDLTLPRVRVAAPTLQAIIRRYRESSTAQATTMAAYKQGFDSLIDYFGADRTIDTITQLEADLWRKQMVSDKYAGPTIAKRCRTAKQLFAMAMRWGLAKANPFAELRAGPQTNPERTVHVPRETVRRLLEKCPDDRWRAIIGLARYAGARTPSESRLLRWSDVDFERRRLTIRSPKTAHHDGHAVRTVPLDPELLVILERLRSAADVQDTLVLPGLKADTGYLWRQIRDFAAAAGCPMWPRAYHNLRGSCATDWCERFPAHTVAKWLGHSPLIAAKHYLTVSDQHFAAAAGLGAGKGSEPLRTGPADASALMPALKTSADTNGHGQDVNPGRISEVSDIAGFSEDAETGDESGSWAKMGATGPRNTQNSSGKPRIPDVRAEAAAADTGCQGLTGAAAPHTADALPVPALEVMAAFSAACAHIQRARAALASGPPESRPLEALRELDSIHRGLMGTVRAVASGGVAHLEGVA